MTDEDIVGKGVRVAVVDEIKHVYVNADTDKIVSGDTAGDVYYGFALISKAGTVASTGTKKDGNGYKATYKKVNGVATWTIGLE